MGAVCIFLGVLAASASPAAAQQSGACQFILGFATLHNLDTEDVGDCLDNQTSQANGDAHQDTSKGLMAWRKADNWTAFTNGYRTWINGPGGLVTRLNTERFPWEADFGAGGVTILNSTLVQSEGQMANPSLRSVPLAGHQVSLPPGFNISVVVSGLKSPRFMAFDAAGNLAVAEDGANRIDLFSSTNGQLASTPKTLIGGLNDPTSVAFDSSYIYVAEANQVSRFAYQSGTIGPQQVIIPNLPAAIDHHTRTVAIGPDGNLYLAMGAPCNVCVSADPRYASIGRYNTDGSGYTLIAKGLRNAVGLAFQPGTNKLWATVNGRDGLGDNVPLDLLTSIQTGADYGFPRCFDNRQPDPQYGSAGGCGDVTLPDVGLQAHSAPLGLAFYSGSQFPADYRGDIFVGVHGSWNRSVPTGYKVIRAHVANGQVVSVTDFATGWHTSGTWGRPVQPVVSPDGSIYLSDDDLGAIYRISYTS